MIEKPFNIFPSVGYKNSQFQILTPHDNIKIDIFYLGNKIKQISISQRSTFLISKLEETGIYTAKCEFEGEIYEQKIIVKDAFRLGSSEFKKSFVFDDSKYSFFLMKDRLLLYDEEKNALLTENHYSPTEIFQIHKNNFLFTTELGTNSYGIVNFGIYNTKSLSMVGELVNDYQTIIVLPNANKAWLFKKSTQTIHSFELISKMGKAFNEILKFENAADYRYEEELGIITINQDDKIIFVDTKCMNKFIEIDKTSKNAIDKYGTNLLRDKTQLKFVNQLNNFELIIDYSGELNLNDTDFLFLGTEFKNSIKFKDLTDNIAEVKATIVDSIADNKTSFSYSFPDDEVYKETIFQHQIFSSCQGLFILTKETIRNFSGISLNKSANEWVASPITTKKNLFSLSYFEQNTSIEKIKQTDSIQIIDYHNHCLVVKDENTNYVFRGKNSRLFGVESSFEFYHVNGNSYLFVKKEELYSIFEISNLEQPVLEKIKVLNDELINNHGVVWYEGEEKYVSGKKFLNAFDLSRKSKIHLNEKIAQHSLFKNASDFKFYIGFIKSSNDILVNPKNANIKDSVIGYIESHSKDLFKIVSQRSNHLYLSIYNQSLKKFQEREIKLETNKYQESYLSPNGKFLVLQDDTNKYIWFDIEKNEKVRFFSGNFLSFSKEGNLIIEEDGRRNVKIIDPLTFSDITPPNYHHYRFLSPDGKLYSQVVLKTRYFNKLNGDKLSFTEVSKLKRDLNEPSSSMSISLHKKQNLEDEKIRINKNRLSLFLKNKSSFNELKVYHHHKITADTIIKIEKYTEIGIVRTNIKAEIIFPPDLQFYNYASFSHDNKYFAYVGKPLSKGLIHLFKLDYNESKNKLEVTDSYLNRIPKKASWVCGFSKTGYFATYDSEPDTYVLKMDEELFKSKTNENELRNNIYNLKSNIYHQHKKWKIIKGKNFLCFSPTGKYIALSEQGYEPLTLNGYGHQESNTVHISHTETGEIIDSFTGHGDYIKANFSKKVTFVAFSEDEKRIMTLSSDGVVFIRDLNIKKSVINSKSEDINSDKLIEI